MPGRSATGVNTSPENNRRFKRAQATARHLGYIVHHGTPFVIYPLGAVSAIAELPSLADLGRWVHDAATAAARAQKEPRP